MHRLLLAPCVLPLVLLIAAATPAARGEKPAVAEPPSVVRVETPYDPRPLMDKLRARVPASERHRMHFLVFGDAKHGPHFKTVLKHADQLKPDFNLTTADLVADGAGPRGVRYYRRLEQESDWFLRKYPTWPTVGNHEESGGKNGVQNFSNFFGLERDLYAFDYGNARFIALGWPKTHRDPERLAWLEKQLAAGKGKHLFVFQHRPYYTVGDKGRGDVRGKPNAATELFEKYGVVAVFAGHDHIYYRTRRGGVHYVISAGAGAPIYALERAAEAIDGDVYYGKVHVPKDQKKQQTKDGKRQPPEFLFHAADGTERRIPGPMHYVVSVEIDGPTVRLKMIDSTHGHTVWDQAVLAGSP